MEKDELLNKLTELNSKNVNLTTLLEESKESKDFFENQSNNLNNEVGRLNDAIFQLQNLFPGKSNSNY